MYVFPLHCAVWRSLASIHTLGLTQWFWINKETIIKSNLKGCKTPSFNLLYLNLVSRRRDYIFPVLMTRQKNQDKAKLGRSGAYKGPVNGCTFWIVYNILPNIWHVESTLGTSLWQNEKKLGTKVSLCIWHGHQNKNGSTLTTAGRPFCNWDWSRGLVKIINPVGAVFIFLT